MLRGGGPGPGPRPGGGCFAAGLRSAGLQPGALRGCLGEEGGLPRPRSGASPPSSRPISFIWVQPHSQPPLDVFRRKHSLLPLRSLPPGCRKEVKGTFPYFYLPSRAVTWSRATQQVWGNGLMHFQKTKPELPLSLHEQFPSDSALSLPPHHAQNPTVIAKAYHFAI